MSRIKYLSVLFVEQTAAQAARPFVVREMERWLLLAIIHRASASLISLRTTCYSTPRPMSNPLCRSNTPGLHSPRTTRLVTGLGAGELETLLIVGLVVIKQEPCRC